MQYITTKTPSTPAAPHSSQAVCASATQPRPLLLHVVGLLCCVLGKTPPYKLALGDGGPDTTSAAVLEVRQAMHLRGPILYKGVIGLLPREHLLVPIVSNSEDKVWKREERRLTNGLMLSRKPAVLICPLLLNLMAEGGDPAYLSAAPLAFRGRVAQRFARLSSPAG